MANALDEVLGSRDLKIVWNLERSRLKSSTYGIDRISGKQFGSEVSWRIPSIRSRNSEKFRPHSLLAIAKPKGAGSYRIICVPTIEDRLIQFSILYKIRDALKARHLLNQISYGLVANSDRTVQSARARATVLREHGKWVYKTDIEKFFDNIPRENLKSRIRKIVPFRSLHEMICSFVDVEIGDGFSANWQKVVTDAGIRTGVGVRQGMPLSPYFAGILLRDLDLKIEKKNLPAIRYVDDIVGFFDSEKECYEFDKFIRSELTEMALKLGSIGIEGSKTKIYRPEDPADFLGMSMVFDGHGKCKLVISKSTLESIEARFAEMTILDNLLQKKITLPFFGARLESMRRGYVAAYEGADNMSDLKTGLSGVCEAALEKVLEELFGEEIHRLGRKERKFLGIL